MSFLLLALLAQPSESARRESFSKAFKDKDPELRAQALRTLNAAREARTVALVVGALKDPVAKVRTAAVEVLGTADDPDASAIKPLAELLRSTKEDAALRLAAARSLAAMPYRHEAIDAMISALAGAPESLYNFAAELSNLLKNLTGQDFGAKKGAGAQWRSWWSSQSSRVLREDAEKRAQRR